MYSGWAHVGSEPFRLGAFARVNNIVKFELHSGESLKISLALLGKGFLR